MANYNKSFSFRNGVQVDEKNFFVNATGLVGIGTSIPRTTLDVIGDLSVSGITTLRGLISSGISSFVDLRVGPSIVMGNSGIITAYRFYGDGSFLEGIPSSQWVDYNQSGIRSSYILRNVVGVATATPTATLQIGGRIELGQVGVGINSSGNVIASGIITAASFVGSGLNITSINATNISSGTLNNARLPSNINISGIATVGTLTATNAYIGVVTFNSNGLIGRSFIGTSFIGGSFYASNGIEINASNLSFTGGSGVSISGTTGKSGQFLVSNGSGSISWSGDISLTGVVTVGVLTSRDIFATGFTTSTNLRVTNVGIITNLQSSTVTSTHSELSRVNSGIITSNSLNSSYSTLGIATAIAIQVTNLNSTGVGTFLSLRVGEIKLNDATTKIETSSGDLNLGASSGIVLVSDNLDVFGNLTVVGVSTFYTGIVPDSDLTAYIGSRTRSFGEAYIDEVQIGVANAVGIISTRSGDLSLDSNTRVVSVAQDFSVGRNASVTGVSTFTGNVTVGGGIIPNTDLISPLGSRTRSFSEAHIDEVQIGLTNAVGIISTKAGNLSLDSNTRVVSVAQDFSVGRNVSVTGVSTFSSASNFTTGILPVSDLSAYIGSRTRSFSEAYIDEVQIGVSNAVGIISTRSGNLSLDSNTRVVSVAQDFIVGRNLNVSGISTLSNLLNVGTGIIPTTNDNAYLGSSTRVFSEAYIDQLTIGVNNSSGIVSTRSGNLSLDSNTRVVSVAQDFSVGRNVSITGVSTFTGIVAIDNGIIPDTDGGAYIGSAQTSFSNIHVGDINLGSASSGIVSTRSGNLTFNSFGRTVSILNDLSVGRNASVTGVSTFTNISNFGTGIIPSSDNNVYLGSRTRSFSEAYIDEVQIGVADAVGIISTRSGDLSLDSNTRVVSVAQDFSVGRNLNVSGVSTFTENIIVNAGILPDSDLDAYIGSSSRSFSEAYIDEVQIGVVDAVGIISTRSGALSLDSNTRVVSVARDFSVGRNVSVTGVSTFTENIIVNAGILPDSDLDSYIGSSSRSFSEAYIDEVQVGVANAVGIISTRSGNLSLDSNTRVVSVARDFSVGRNVSVTGLSTFTGDITVNAGILPDSDLDAYIGSRTKSFSEAYIDEVQVGVANAVGIISTRSGNLSLDSNTRVVSVAQDFSVGRNVSVTGLSTFTSNITVNAGIIPNTDLISSIGSSSRSFSEAYIDEVQIGVADAVGIISTRSGNLSLDSNTRVVSVSRDFSVGRNVSVTGVSTFTGDVNVNGISSIAQQTVSTGIRPTSDKSAYLGTNSAAFSEAYIDEVTIGVADTNAIGTRSGLLKLDSFSGIVTTTDSLYANKYFEVPNLVATGIATVGSFILPNSNNTGSVGSSSKVFGSAYISQVRIGVSGNQIIETSSGNLTLQSATNVVDVNDNLSITNGLVVGGNLNANILFANSDLVGIGTSSRVSSENKLEIYSSTDAAINVNSLTSSSILKLSSGNFGGKISFDSSNNLTIENNTKGYIYNIINSLGAVGLNTGNFEWINGGNGSTLMALTYKGDLGIGITSPTNNLHVVGTSTVTGNAYFGSDVYIAGTIQGASINIPSVVNSNIYSNSGISTFNNINVTGNIGINTTDPIAKLDGKDYSALFSRVGLGTTTFNDNEILNVSGLALISSGVGIGTTSLITSNGQFGEVQLFDKTIDLYTSSINLKNDSTIGFNTTQPKSILDLSNVGAATTHAYVILPTVPTSTITGYAGTSEGAIIFNSSTKKFQGYDGTAWVNLN